MKTPPCIANNKKSMECNILNNYRPVLVLTFVSNVIERAVAFHLTRYLFNNTFNESLQCASFDTVEHIVPFSRLKDMFGLSGKVLE